MQTLQPKCQPTQSVTAAFLTMENPFTLAHQTQSMTTGQTATAQCSQPAFVITEPLSFQAQPAAISSASQSEAPALQPVILAGNDGSEIAVDEENRITSFTDATSRTFRFAYDRLTGELNCVSDDHGTWVRQLGLDGRLSNLWLNLTGPGQWQGKVYVDSTGYTLATDCERVTYKTTGTKVIEYLVQGEVQTKSKEDRYGNMAVEDVRKQKISYRFIDGRRAVRDLATDSLLGYDDRGNLCVMRDTAGNRFEFAGYDETNQPHVIVNELGTWEKVGEARWQNQENGQIWQGEVQVHVRGAYTFTDLSGKRVTRSLDATTTEEYCDLRTIYNGKNESRHYSDGKPFIGPAIEATVGLNVAGGRLSAIALSGDNGNVLVVHAHSDIRAEIQAEPGQAVAAFDEGVVVFSSRQKDASDKREDGASKLTESELQAIDNFRLANRIGGELVIVQCAEKQSQIVWYEFFWGLDMVNVVAGDRVAAGQPIARLNGNAALKFAVRQGSVAGRTVAISAKF